MKNKPIIFTILAVLLLIEPTFKIFYLKYRSDFDFSVVLANILHRVTVFDLFKFWFMFPIAGLCLIWLRKWTYYLFLGIQLYAIYDFVTYEPYTFPYNSQEPFFFNYILVVANVLLLAYFLLPQVRKVFFDQSLRWWETKKRYKATIPCQLVLPTGNLKCNILNISQTGVFVNCKESLANGEVISVEFDYRGLNFSLSAEVVSEHNFEGQHGLGLKFNFDNYREFINLLRLMWSLKSELKLLENR